MTPTHHTPPEPGAIRSIAFPHMACLGTYRDMLSQDLHLAGRQRNAAEGEVEDCIEDWQHSHGEARAKRRGYLRAAIVRLRVARGQASAALRRLAGHRVGREAA
jgi:hypothetical protein